jgi:hypothetical protein
MFNSIDNKLIALSNGKPNQRIPLVLINSEKVSQKERRDEEMKFCDQKINESY